MDPIEWLIIDTSFAKREDVYLSWTDELLHEIPVRRFFGEHSIIIIIHTFY